jgi:hypothetical protein
VCCSLFCTCCAGRSLAPSSFVPARASPTGQCARRAVDCAAPHARTLPHAGAVLVSVLASECLRLHRRWCVRQGPHDRVAAGPAHPPPQGCVLCRWPWGIHVPRSWHCDTCRTFRSRFAGVAQYANAARKAGLATTGVDE